MTNKDILAACVAMSLYRYNVSAVERAENLYDGFSGQCAELPDLVRLVDDPNWATQMATPTALLYLRHGLARYDTEAYERVNTNLGY